MIDPRELRIGNYVICGGKISKVEGLTIHNGWNSIWLDTVKYEYSDTSKIEDIEPIPLTEEWLVKLGFVTQDAELDFMEYAKEHGEGNIFFSIFNDGGLDNKHNSPFYIETEGERNGFFHIYKHQIKYVHQLQSLYFSLTGEELTIY